MTEWWTYNLRDLLLFSPRIYYRLFELYNLDMLPLQLVTLCMGLAILLLWRHGGASVGQIIAALLALCWLWVAWAYHWQRYASINWAANYFAVAFSPQAMLLLWLGVVRRQFIYHVVAVKHRVIGLGLLAFSLFCYPLLGYVVGRSRLQSEVFGMAPDPTTLAMLGTLLLFRAQPLWWLFPVPVIWCMITGATLWAMDSPEFFISPMAALVVVGIAAYDSRQ